MPQAFKAGPRPGARETHLRGFVEGDAHYRVAAFRDSPVIVPLARLQAARREAEMPPDQLSVRGIAILFRAPSHTRGEHLERRGKFLDLRPLSKHSLSGSAGRLGRCLTRWLLRVEEQCPAITCFHDKDLQTAPMDLLSHVSDAQ